MIKYFGSNEYNKLIELLKRYDLESGSFFASDEYQHLAETAFKDIDLFEERYKEKYNVSLEEKQDLSDAFNKRISEIEAELNKKNKNAALEMKESINKFKADQDAQKNDLMKKYHNIDSSFIPKMKEIEKNKQVNKDNYLKEIEKLHQESIKQKIKYHEEIDKIDQNNEKSLIDSNVSFAINEESHTESIPSINEKYAALEKEEITQYDDLKNQLNDRIKEQKQYMMDNTVKLNESITESSNKVSEKLSKKVAPYDKEIAKLNKEKANIIETYKALQDRILEEFKNNLQSCDTEISELHNLERVFDSNYQSERIKLKEDWIKDTNDRLGKADVQIAKAKVKLKREDNKANQKIVNDLVKERVNLAKKMNEGYIGADNAERDKYLSGKNNYIAEIEKLRNQKLKYEYAKNMAIKNLELEKDAEINIINLRIQLLTKERENNSSFDQFDENLKISELRLKRDLENANIDYEINELERQIKYNETLLKYKKIINQAAQQAEIEKLNVSDNYRKKVIENDKNLINISNLLLAQKNEMIDQIFKDKTNSNVEFAKDNYIFHDNCEDIQYEIFKNEHNYENKKIDRELSYLNEAYVLYSKYLDDILNLLKRKHEAEANFNEHQARSKLYKDRFDTERQMIKDAYDLLHKELSKIINFENYLLTAFCSFDIDVFNSIKVDTILLISTLNNLKFTAIDDYYNKVVEVIQNRIDFLKDIKYKKIIENVKSETEYNKNNLNDRLKKLSQTIENYHAALDKFKEELKQGQVQQEILKNELDTALSFDDDEKRNEILVAINNNDTDIKNINEKIKNNRKYISDLSINVVSVKRQILQTDKRYNDELIKIKASQEYDAKLFYDVLENLKKETKVIKDTLIPSNEILNSTKFEYSKAVDMTNKLIINNNLLLSVCKSKYSSTGEQLETAVRIELKNLEENFTENYNKGINDLNQLIDNTNQTFEESKKSMERNFVSDITAFESIKKRDKSALLLKLRSITNQSIQNAKNHQLELDKMDKKLETNIKINQDNLGNYRLDCTNDAKNFTNDYHNSIADINRRYNSKQQRIKNKIEELTKNDQKHSKNNLTLKESTTLDIYNQYKATIAHYKDRQKDIQADLKSSNRNSKMLINDIKTNLANSLNKNREEYQKLLQDAYQNLVYKINEAQKAYRKEFFDGIKKDNTKEKRD